MPGSPTQASPSGRWEKSSSSSHQPLLALACQRGFSGLFLPHHLGCSTTSALDPVIIPTFGMEILRPVGALRQSLTRSGRCSALAEPGGGPRVCLLPRVRLLLSIVL